MTKYVCPSRCSPDLAGNPIQPTVPIGDIIAMVVGEAPGSQEEAQRRFFVGKAGQELTNYLYRAGIPRDRCYISNILKCHPPGDRDPKKMEVEICTSILLQELESVKPRFIIAVGRFAAQWFLGDINMEMVHGIPYRITSPVGSIVIPVYHPAAGLHDSTNMSNIMGDFLSAKATMTGQIKPRVIEDNVEPPPYHVLGNGEDPRPYMTELVGVDTETQDENDTPWCVQFSSGEQGHIILADNHKSLSLFADYVSNPDILCIIHNTLFDLKVLRSMGILPSYITDTMIMAYLLQTEPQGLKPLSFRHLGVKMDEYEEVVGPRTQEMALEYLIQASCTDWGKLPAVAEIKAGKAKVRQPQPINQKINRILNDLSMGKEVDLFDRWMKTPMEDGRGTVEKKMGRMRKAYLKDVEPEKAYRYAATDPWSTFHIYPVLKAKIDSLGLNEALERDLGVIPMVECMQSVGMPINPPYFQSLREDFTSEMDAVLSDIHSIVGDVYPGSDKQVLELLDRLKLKEIKYQMKNGKMVPVQKKMTDIAAMELLKDKHPVIPMIMRWKSLDKLVDSFINVLLDKAVLVKPGCIGDEEDKIWDEGGWRIRTTLRVTRVVTGRLASSNPNLMAIPVRTEDGRKIRRGFEARSGYKLVSGDQSQVEMRVTAHISQDSKMIDVFRTGKDIHSYTASGMFRLPIDQLDEMKHRYPAKRVGFGILNLISAGKLLKELQVGGAEGWDEKGCQKLINDWFNLYTGVANYVEERKAEARRTGMVRDLAGRIRLVPEIMSVHRSVVEAGIRQAVNGPIQMGAQAIEKEAMRQCRPIYEEMFTGGIVTPLIQIHDDVVWEIKEEYVDVIIPIIKYTMEHCMDDRLSVPLKVDFKVGDNWENMEKYKVRV